ncbi:hypothetical protein [Novosphingobium sp.]|uniref:glycosyltransferase family protein n=1 Tax=Novosphingobium sp. TaxID=1874826 RepID=UPI00262EB2E6|nr:hypothetical protein [Novosphingobium sp.]
MRTFAHGASGPRIALYSHDTMGLGHIRRNQLIAMALTAPPLNATVLLITGVREGGAFPMPGGIDSVILPAYRKGSDGAYSARSLAMSLPQLVGMRSALIDLTLQQFQPDIFVADNVPDGALGELLPALERLRRETGTYCVLGLRDILDCPDAIRREWSRKDTFAVIRRNYDAVWIYGAEAVFDTVGTYGFPADISALAHYTGYLDPFSTAAQRLQVKLPPRTGGEVVLCSVGGGQDGFELARAFVEAKMPDTMQGLVATGPLMPGECKDQLATLIARRSNLTLIDAVCDIVPLLPRVDRVIGMAGYNSANEVLASGRPALFVPRTVPRTEQLIRAERFQELGLASCLPADVLTPAAIAQWLAAPAKRSAEGHSIDFGGLSRIAAMCGAIIASGDLTKTQAQAQPRIASLA